MVRSVAYFKGEPVLMEEGTGGRSLRGGSEKPNPSKSNKRRSRGKEIERGHKVISRRNCMTGWGENTPGIEEIVNYMQC